MTANFGAAGAQELPRSDNVLLRVSNDAATSRAVYASRLAGSRLGMTEIEWLQREVRAPAENPATSPSAASPRAYRAAPADALLQRPATPSRSRRCASRWGSAKDRSAG